MGLFSSTTFDNLQDLLVDQLADLYDAEKRLTDALPKMANAACSPALGEAFRHHLHQTEEQVRRLDRVFDIMGKKPEREACEAMKGLIKEGEQMIGAKGDDQVRDAALIAAAQRVEHYEIAGYGTARTLAQQLGYDDIGHILQTTLDEEKQADQKLTNLAEQSINIRAAHA